ncbi:hypothetical protein FOA52_013842 [Chlamydomonas sp. UWO 241]|nr:hypothetical protein FOA52_013842 [Chlamydomonas sp. UWO 241]
MMTLVKRLTFASLITSQRRLRFIIPLDADVEKFRGLVNAAWVTAVAPRGSRSTFLRAEKTKATLVVGDRVEPMVDVTDIVVLFTDIPRQESVTAQSILRSSGVEYSTKDLAPRLVTYFDERVVGTPVALDTIAPFLRPDRMLMRDADDKVRTAILMYSPPLLVLRKPHPSTAMPSAYMSVLDEIVSRMFQTSEDSGGMLAECALVVKLADAAAAPAMTVYDRTRDAVGRMSSTLSLKWMEDGPSA